jgi:hypothetical protein
MRSIVIEMGVSERTVRRIMQDIRYKSYAMRRGQFMSEATKIRWVEKAKKLLAKIKHPTIPNQLVLFSDEKNFNQDQKVNKRNNRWLYSDPTEVPIVMSTKFPATVMVLWVVSNERDVMPPHIFPKGLRVNTAECIKVLDKVFKPWMVRSRGAPLRLPAGRGARPQQQADPGLVSGEPPGVLAQGVMASQFAGL